MGAAPSKRLPRLTFLLGAWLALGGGANAEPKDGPAFTMDGCETEDAVEVVPLDEIEGVKLPAGTRGAAAPGSGKVLYVLCTPGGTPESIERKLRAALSAAGFAEKRFEEPGVVQSVWYRGTLPLYFTCLIGPNWELTTCPRCDAWARNPPQPPPPPSCDDLRELARRRTLYPGVAACLEQRLVTSTDSAERARISTLLLTDAELRHQDALWGRLALRHLTEVDPGDPQLALDYATDLWLHGEDAAEILKWANAAHRARDRWPEEVRVARVVAADALRAKAAYTAALSDPSDAARATALDYARIWCQDAPASYEAAAHVAQAGGRAGDCPLGR